MFILDFRGLGKEFSGTPSEIQLCLVSRRGIAGLATMMNESRKYVKFHCSFVSYQRFCILLNKIESSSLYCHKFYSMLCFEAVKAIIESNHARNKRKPNSIFIRRGQPRKKSSFFRLICWSCASLWFSSKSKYIRKS